MEDSITIVEFNRTRDSYPYESIEFTHNTNGVWVEVWKMGAQGKHLDRISRREAARMMMVLRVFSRELYSTIRRVY